MVLSPFGMWITGPFLERDLSATCRPRFIGKHTNLISRKLGNWIFLSEIITTVELEPDESKPIIAENARDA